MNFTEGKAIYLQIADLIVEKVLLKQLMPGERLDSVRDLAIRITVNPNTVIRAYAHLESLGIIVMQRGIGYFLSDDAVERAKNIRKAEFLETDAPMFFKKMSLLNISFSELKKIFSDVEV